MTELRLIKHDYLSASELPIESGSVDLVFSDPPYNQRVKYDNDPTNDNLPDDQYKQLVSSIVEEAFRILRPGGTLWWLCPARHGGWLWPMLLRHGRLLYDAPIIWHERFAQYQDRRLTSDYRLLFPVVKPAPVKTADDWGENHLVFNPDQIRVKSVRQELGDPRANPAGRVPGHVWTTRRLQGTAKDRVDWHPAQLPPETLEQIVKGWTNMGHTVADLFAGSGSMGLVALKNDRSFVGVDRSPFYLGEINERLKHLAV